MTTSFTATDHQLMTRALRLAERGAFTTKPNPMVGCVIAQGEQIVGEGWHERAGEPHAEVHALRNAGERAKGATAYVTLEPCGLHGRTPPCADALIAAGVARVVVASADASQHEGNAAERLRAAGIDVQHGLLQAQARQLNAGFFSRIERGRPWVRVKLGASLDGRTAMANGDSKWITGEDSRRDVHLWRARAGAILTGANTVLADDPSLTVRFDDNVSGNVVPFVAPMRVVLDPGLATVARGRVRDGDAPTLYLHAPNVKLPRELRLQHAAVPATGGNLDLGAVLATLAERGINEVQVEAGATLAGAFLAGGWVDELLLYVAPVLLGERARPLFMGLGIDEMAQRLRLQVVESRQIGADMRLLLRRE
ncbi:MAG: bifunctional diaminohydroxyphosphoribosylaminopyrimidine deaminase/5-amino-6-(5-phosphoribosylamino)uracil reductase RibD [Pseudoxanthomonas sp.]